MRIRSSKWYNALMASALAALGFESCDKIIDAPDEYGAPYATYRVIGTVTDEEGQPIEGIQAKMDVSGDVLYPLIESAKTDNEGNFSLDLRDNRFEEFNRLILSDIDGPANGGEFLPDTIRLDEMKMSQTKKGSGWYQGEYTYTGSFKMKKKAETKQEQE